MAAMEFNPWNVSSLEEFLFYNCPECESKHSTKEQFVGHAVVAHENARDILMTILRTEKMKASNENGLIEEVAPEGSDDNGNDNFIGIQIAKVESITEDSTEISGSSSVEAATEVIDEAEELITSNNEELDENLDTSRTETISSTSNTESLSDDEPETVETPTLGPPVTIKVTSKQKKPKKYRLTQETKCKLCGKEFYSKYCLKSHVQGVHEGVRLKCGLCPKTYASRGALLVHIQAVHRGKTFKCDLCPKTYSTRGYLSDHIQAVHRGKTYKCDLCPKTYIARRNLSEHIETAHRGKTFKCDRCDKVLTSRAGIRRHKARYHRSKDRNM